MNNNTSKFQYILMGVFAFLILVGVLLFSFSKGKGGVVANITIWGTVSNEVFDGVVYDSPVFKDKTVKLSYFHKNSVDFNSVLVDALASGNGPDAIFAPHDFIIKNRNKLYSIPFQTITERTFIDTYIDESSIFLFSSGIIGIPVTVDPLVMYWNKDIFSSAGIALPPKEWAQFFDLSSSLTKKDGALNISKSASALGEFGNVTNAKELITALIIQAGNPIVTRRQSGPTGVLDENFNKATPPTEAALNFYTQFSNPAKSFYSWNRSLPSSQDFFTAGDLAVYFGFASELPIIKFKNPNINFDVATIPQSQSGENNTTYGRMMAFAITNGTRNLPQTFTTILALSQKSSAENFAKNLNVVPARRDSVSQIPEGIYNPVFYRSALWARGWLDPDSVATTAIFREMIESITSGRARISEAIRRADSEIDRLFSQ